VSRTVGLAGSAGAEKIRPKDIIKIVHKKATLSAKPEFVRVEHIYTDRVDKQMKIAYRQMTFRIEETDVVRLDSLRSVLKATQAELKKQDGVEHAFMKDYQSAVVTSLEFEEGKLKLDGQLHAWTPKPGSVHTLKRGNKVWCITVVAKSPNTAKQNKPGQSSLVKRHDKYFGVKLKISYTGTGGEDPQPVQQQQPQPQQRNSSRPTTGTASAVVRHTDELPTGWEYYTAGHRSTGEEIPGYKGPNGAKNQRSIPAVHRWVGGISGCPGCNTGSIVQVDGNENEAFTVTIYPNREGVYK
jgi:hypothetical protein